MMPGDDSGMGGAGANGSSGAGGGTGDAMLGGGSGTAGTSGGEAMQSSSRVGQASYEQMLRNAHVHDTDGDLSDLENSYTPGSLGW